MERDWFEFIETTGFSKKLDQVAGPETLRAIQSDLIEDPERWPVVRGTNELVKAESQIQAHPAARGEAFGITISTFHIAGAFIYSRYSVKARHRISPQTKKRKWRQ